MKRICSIMQPTYFPWIGYFDLMNQVDCFVLYDDVQFAKRSWQSRNRIPSINGVMFLTVPVMHSASDTTIMDICIDNNQAWQKKQLKSLAYNYKKAPFFDEVYPFVESLLIIPFELIADMHTHIIRAIAEKIGIDTTIVKSSELKPSSFDRVDRLIAICEEVGANLYLSTRGSSAYLLEEQGNERFAARGMELRYHNYQHPVYPSIFDPFTPYMCILDLLFMVGFSEALHYIKAGNRESIQIHEALQSSSF